jgi:prepilin-type processing-associated H-X9-DG protein
LTTSNEPGFAVAADRNPWIKSPASDAGVFTAFKPDAGATGGTGTSDDAKKGNAINHQGDGQQVLFLDGHVEFAKRAYCSIEDDNIYTVSRNATQGDALGIQPIPAAGLTPANRKDSLLVHDPDNFKVGTIRDPRRPGG